MADEDENAVNFRYVGDPNDDLSGPTVITLFGVQFEKGGDYTEVSDPALIRKLRGHSHVEEEGQTVKAKVITRDELPGLGLEEMKDVARLEGVAFDDDTTKPKLMKAIRAARKLKASEADED